MDEHLLAKDESKSHSKITTSNPTVRLKKNQPQMNRSMKMRRRSIYQPQHGPLVNAFLRDMAALRQEALRRKAFTLFSQTVPEFEISDQEIPDMEDTEGKIQQSRVDEDRYSYSPGLRRR
jgi:hypothetical protein